MGGSAFTGNPWNLYTPRMPKELYEVLKEESHELLKGAFEHVASPVDGPGKTDFGDIDIFVAVSKKKFTDRLDLLSRMLGWLGATHWIPEKSSASFASYAIPWPEDWSGSSNSGVADEDEEPRKKHIQVDVHVFRTAEEMEWMLFRHAHGDFWNVAGSTINSYGLTIDNEALHVRIPELEGKNNKLSRVFLTSDQNKIMEFLGLPFDIEWLKPFPSAEAMFSYIAQCRMFCPQSAEWARFDVGPDSPNLKKTYRWRIKNRPVYREWFTEYLPRCRADERFADRRTTREAVLQEAFANFAVEEEYKSRRTDFLKQEEEASVKRILRSQVAKPQPGWDISDSLRHDLREAFRKIILEGDNSYPVRADSDMRLPDGQFDIDSVRKFVEKNKYSHALQVAVIARKEEELTQPAVEQSELPIRTQ